MKRNVLVGVRFSPEEHAYLCEQAEKDVETQKRNGTKNLSAYIRKRVLERSGYQEEIQRRNTDPKILERIDLSVSENRDEHQPGNQTVTHWI